MAKKKNTHRDILLYRLSGGLLSVRSRALDLLQGVQVLADGGKVKEIELLDLVPLSEHGLQCRTHSIKQTPRVTVDKTN